MIDKAVLYIRCSKVVELIEKITLTGGIKVLIVEGSRMIL